jgi:RNA polymerase primary sigma factor
LYVKLQKNKNSAGKQLSDEELSDMLQISKEHLQQLIQKGDHAKTVLVRANMRLVFHIARFYRFRGVSYPDLVQEGIVGLMKAVDKFDPDRGFRFSTYASWWIKQAVSRAIAEKSRIVRLPVHIHDLMISVSRAEKQFSLTHMRKPSSVELADQLALPLNKVELLLKCAKDVNSIDESAYQNRGKVQKDDMQVRDKLVSQIQEPSFLNQKNAQNSELHRAMKYLSEREAQIIEMRFGLLDGNEMTLEEIGKIFNVTRERIRQIEARALSKLRQPFKNEFRDTFTETLTLTDGTPAEIEKRAMLF